MVNIEATTPQLKVFQKWIDAFSSLDITEIDPILSKNYIYETFPKSIGLPDETKEEFIKRYKGTLTLFTKIEVRIQHRRTTLKLADPCLPTPRLLLTK